MHRKLSQLLLLIWKNYVLQKRHWLRTIFEIGLPILVSLILIWLRNQVDYTDYKDPTLYGGYSIDRLPENLTREKKPLPSPVPCVWRMAYTPNGSAESQVMGLAVENLRTGLVTLDTGYGFKTESEMLDFLAKNNSADDSEFLGGVVFHNKFPSDKDLPTNVTYSIRLKASQRNDPSTKYSSVASGSRWYTNVLFALVNTPGPREKEYPWGGMPGYMREGFLSLQHAIDLALIQFQAVSTDNFTVQMRRYPYPPYNDDLFVTVIQRQLPFLILISFVITAISITKDVVLEKERKLKESMKIMGLNNWLHWMAWYLKYILFLFISVAFITLLYKIPVGTHGAILNHTDPSVLLLFFVMYSLAFIAQCFAVSVLFSTANTGAVFMGLIWFFSYVPYFFISPRYETMSRGLKMASCLLTNTGMSMGAYLIGLFEGTGEGIQWSNINRPVSVDDNFSFLDVNLMFLADIVWCLVFMWYVEAVFPGSYGVPRKWYFPFQVSYWCGLRVRKGEELPLTPSGQIQFTSLCEAEPQGLYNGIKIEGLTKVFGKGKTAVKSLSLNMYEGQITALLGHNGAGKTTTLSMLTGMFPPTSGMAVVNGYDIRTEIDGVRQSLGLCPQHDVLFDRLTVKEHLYFFAKLKGCPSSRVKEEVDNYIIALELQDKKNAQARTLSGGMRRKLCVGIALIYDSKVVMLDEPTSGMDPSARRFTWDLLQRHRSGRTILLTTHHMDEADLLGDRIAILAKGELQCCGTSLFLKKKYGVGYHMTIAKAPSCDVARVSALIAQHVPGMVEESNVGMELSYILPEESVGQFEQLFTDLETQRQELGINSYGASVTTLEEVFLKVDPEEQAGDPQEEAKFQGSAAAVSHGPIIQDSTDCLSGANGAKRSAILTLPDVEQGSSDTEWLVVPPERNTGMVLYLQQFCAMFQKRMYHTWRNLLVMAIQLLIPLFMTAVALIAEKTFPAIGESPPLTVDIRSYGQTEVPYFISDIKSELLKPFASSYVDYMNQLNQDTVCVNNVTDANSTSMIGYLLDVGGKELVTFNRKNLVAAVFEEDQGKQNITGTAFFNDQPYHTAPASLSAIDNALMKHYVKGNHMVTTINYPLPRSVHEKANDDLESQLFTGFTIAFNMLFGMSFLASSFVVFLVKENANKAKHVQFVSGVHTLNFWLSTFVWDLINYTVPCVLIVVAFAAFGVEAYANDYRFFAIFLLLFLHGWSIIPLMYLFSFLFTVPSTAFVRLTMFNIIFGIALFMAITILQLPSLKLQSVANVLSWVFSFSPSYCLGKGLSDFYQNYGALQVCNSSPFMKLICEDPNVTDTNPLYTFNDNYLGFEPPGIGTELLSMAISGCLYFALVILLENGLLRFLMYRLKDLCCSTSESNNLPNSLQQQNILDDDVLAERARIMDNDNSVSSDTLVMRDLRKVYSSTGKHPVVAVEGTSLGIPAGECFGLLGVNGAGKTTTFKMLTGDEAVSGGEAYVDRFNIKTNIKQAQQRIGYCPQFDALIDQLTGRETLRLYARLRGLKESLIEAKVTELLAMFSLTEHADKLTKTYSGGNKRKLSTTIALIGDPPIVFLDEPSTGMDPVTKRLLWKALCQVRNEGRCIVLTSHSMEECEALCTRLAIMVNGQVKCLGSTQHLKSRFGQGFTVLAKVSCRDGVPNMTQLKQFMETQFPGCKLKDEHQGMVHYHITNTQLTWAQIFGTMERAKSRFDIEDYSVSQTTLEQVFLNFARMQREDDPQS